VLHADAFHMAVAALADSTTVVSVRGDVDVATSPTLRRLLAAVQVCRYREDSNAPVVIDLSRVTLLDASGLTVLVDAARSARRDGYTLVLRNPSRPSLRVLEITQLTPVFRINASASDGGEVNPASDRYPDLGSSVGSTSSRMAFADSSDFDRKPMAGLLSRRSPRSCSG
jgi:anti-sigma B factor antagonist